MKRTQRIRRDCLPQTIIRHLQQQGLAWGHDLDAGCIHIKTEVRHDKS